MKKVLLALIVPAILLVGCLPAFAGNEILLGASSGAPIKFTGTGNPGAHNFNVTFNISNLLASGFGSLSSSGFYSISNSGSTIFSNGSCGSGCFMLGESGPLAFKYGSSAGGSDLLTGNLFFTDIVQSAMGGGIFNDSLVINFVVTGGDLASSFATSNGIVSLQIKFTTNQDLSTILNGQTLMAKVVGGSVFPVPEPATLALMGAGLLGIAGLGRKDYCPANLLLIDLQLESCDTEARIRMFRCANTRRGTSHNPSEMTSFLVRWRQPVENAGSSYYPFL